MRAQQCTTKPKTTLWGREKPRRTGGKNTGSRGKTNTEQGKTEQDINQPLIWDEAAGKGKL